MSPRRDEPSQGSQITAIIIALLIVFALGAAYFKLTGSVF